MDVSKADIIGGKGGEQVCRGCGISASTLGKKPPLCSECYQDEARRDNFAMAALTGLLAAKPRPIDKVAIVEQAYELADAMMKARKK